MLSGLSHASPGRAREGQGSQVCVLVAQPCPTLCDPKDCSPPGSSVCG